MAVKTFEDLCVITKFSINICKNHRVVWSSQVFCYYCHPFLSPPIGRIESGRSVDRQAPASAGCVIQTIRPSQTAPLSYVRCAHLSAAPWISRNDNNPYLHILLFNCQATPTSRPGAGWQPKYGVRNDKHCGKVG